MPAPEQVNSLVERVAARFDLKRDAVRVIYSPYRICPLGAHIDHQRGAVTAMALDHGILLAYVPHSSPLVRIQSEDYAGEVEVPLDGEVPAAQSGDWGNYVRGAILALQQKHRLRSGLVGLICGSMPEGGLSSSAAVGVAYLLALEDANELDITRPENIRLDQYIENTYLGLKNGVLDQAAILLSRRDHLTRIHCASLQYEQWPRPANAGLFGAGGLLRSAQVPGSNRLQPPC